MVREETIKRYHCEKCSKVFEGERRRKEALDHEAMPVIEGDYHGIVLENTSLGGTLPSYEIFYRSTRVSPKDHARVYDNVHLWRIGTEDSQFIIETAERGLTTYEVEASLKRGRLKRVDDLQLDEVNSVDDMYLEGIKEIIGREFRTLEE